jgi:hypothetical protein
MGEGEKKGRRNGLRLDTERQVTGLSYDNY